MRITLAMRNLLWALASGDMIRWHDGSPKGPWGRKRNPYWRTVAEGRIHDRRTCCRALRQGLLVQLSRGEHERLFSLSACGRMALAS